MKQLIFSFLLVFVTGNFLFSQTITVTDADDKSGLFNVAVYNESGSKFCYTNRYGKADISIFSADETILLQHFSYEIERISLSKLREQNFVVSLRKRVFVVEEFIVSANRWEQDKNEIPNKIVAISAASVEIYNPQSAADLLASGGEVFVQKSQLGGGSPMIRGFSTNRVLIVVDGVRLNNAIYREGNIQNVISLDPLSIERTEVIFGPGAYIYGSDAIGGVMDFHTYRPMLTTTDQPMVRTNLLTRYSTANKEQTGHFYFTIGGKKIGFLTSVTYSDFNDLKMGSVKHDSYLRNEYVVRENGVDIIRQNSDPRVQYYSGYSQFNTMNKLRYRINDNVDLELSSHYSRISDVPRYDRLIQYRNGQLRYGAWYYGPQIWMMNNLQATLGNKNRFYDHLKATVSQQVYKESRHERKLGSSTLTSQNEQVNILSLNIDLDKELVENKKYLYWGTEMVYNNVISEGSQMNVVSRVETPAATRYPDGENIYSSFSLYGGYKNNLTEKITFNTGGRFNYAGLTSFIDDNSFYNLPFTSFSLHNSALTGSAGIVIRPDDKTQINVNASTGFRAPNLDDTGKVFESAPGVVVVPNPDLKPEYAWNIDLGIARDFGEIFHTELTAYYTILDNAMVRRDFLYNNLPTLEYNGVDSKVEAIVNTGSATTYGLQGIVQLNITSRIKARSVINLSDGKDDEGIPLRHIAPLFGSTHLTYETTRFTADLYSVYNGTKPFEKMSPSEIEKPYLYEADGDGNPYAPGWYTLNFKISLNLYNWGSINAGVENILDHRYRPYSSGIVSPGRNFIISLKAVI